MKELVLTEKKLKLLEAVFLNEQTKKGCISECTGKCDFLSHICQFLFLLGYSLISYYLELKRKSL